MPKGMPFRVLLYPLFSGLTNAFTLEFLLHIIKLYYVCFLRVGPRGKPLMLRVFKCALSKAIKFCFFLCREFLIDLDKALFAFKTLEGRIILLNTSAVLSDLFSNLPRTEALKSRYGSFLQSSPCFLIKKSYADQIEIRISDVLLRLQIVILK